MPQLTSGRHVGFSHDRLMAWANAQTDNGQWLRFVITGVEPADLWPEMEVVYYRAERSLDGFRYNMITNKAAWQDELIYGEARETNNPGAQFDLPADEEVPGGAPPPPAQRSR